MRRIALALAALMAAVPAAAQPQVACRYTYGGETLELVAEAVDSPYGVEGIAVGSYFRFRVVFQDRPADLASIKIYTYADRDDGPVPIHQASFPWPPRDHGDGYGFTGMQFVYEPVRDGELQYFCRVKP